MEDIQIESHVAELVQIIGDKASEEDIRKELLRRLSRYCQSVDSTKRAIVYDLCGEDFTCIAGESIVTTPIREAPEREGTFTLICRILFSKVYRKTGEDGRSSCFTKSSVADVTGSMPFVIWDRTDLIRGRTYVFRGCTRGEYRVVISATLESANMVKESDRDIPVDTEQLTRNALYISDIGFEGDNVDIRGTITKLDHETRTNKDGKTQNVTVGTLSDGMTDMRFIDYSDRDFEVWDHILSIGTKVVSNHGELQIWLGDNTFEVE